MNFLSIIGDSSLWNFVIALTLLMIGNVITGIINAQEEVNFKWSKLKNGAIKYLLFLFAYICVVIAANLFQDLVISINGEQINLMEAIEAIKTAILTLYFVKFIQNLLQYFKLKKEGTTFVPENSEYTIGSNSSSGEEEVEVSSSSEEVSTEDNSDTDEVSA